MNKQGVPVSWVETSSVLSPFQQRVWFLEQLDTVKSKSNIVALYELKGQVDPRQMQQTLDRLVAASGRLRRVFVDGESAVSQRVQAEIHGYGIDIPETDEAGDAEAIIDRLVSEFEAHPFDLSTGPLFKVHLHPVSHDSYILLIASHRLILDLYSIDWLAQALLGPEAPGWVDSSGGKPADNGFPGPPLLGDAPSTDGFDSLLSALDNASLVCELPTDFPRPGFQSFNTGYYQSVLRDTAREAVATLSEHHAVSPQAVALSAYFALLYRYTAQNDILIGCSHRPAAEAPLDTHQNTVVIRQEFEPQLPVETLIQYVESSYQPVLGETHQPPFARLVDIMKPERDLSRSPIVQHGFAFLTAPFNDEGSTVGIRRIYHSALLMQMDLMLSFSESEGDYHLTWHYDTCLFEPATIARFHRHYEQMLDSMAKDDALAVEQVVLTSPEEYHQITVAWNQTDRQVEDFDFVYRLFEKQAERTPEAIAVREPGYHLTYRELNQRANQLANLLVDLGVGADTIVAFLEDRCINYLVTLLAINKAGGAFLPLSSMYPQKRIAQILEKSDAALAIAGDSYTALLQAAIDEMPEGRQSRLLLLSSALEESQRLSSANLPARCEFHHLAYVMFTSGSTGEPKGVMVEHAGMINHNYGKIYDLEMNSADILAQTGRQTFDIMVWQFVAPLIVGATVYVMPDEIALDAFRLLEEADRCGITILQLVPVNIEVVLDVALVQGENRPRLAHLRWMVPTGDALHTDLCRRWLSTYPETRMLNTYGATECSDDQCHYVISEPPAETYRPPIMTVGRPIINTQVYILDEWMQPVPVGVVGELYIGGIGVGRGYLKEPERTAATFVPNPFDDSPNSRLYKSGDQSRYLPDGTIEFLGRIGHMLKIRGFRIEPGEIQSVLNRHAAIAQSTVTAHEFNDIGRQLVAYVVPRPDQKVNENELRDYVRQHLADYMVPPFIVTLNEIPLTPNGKVDRKALPIPDVGQAQREIVAPASPTEQALADIWKAILRQDEIGVLDNFFEIGGHSLLALQLFTRIYARFKQKLPLATIFRASTIRELAAVIDGQIETRSELQCVVPIHQGSPDRPPIFCIHAHGGHVARFYNLARYVGDDQSVYGIQALGVDGNQEPPNRFEDFASAYLAEVKTIQPSGPYYFVGDCLGGTIGFEMTRQLEETGEEVALLVLLEDFRTGGPELKPGVPRVAYRFMYLARQLVFHWKNLVAAPRTEKTSYAGMLVQKVMQELRRNVLSRLAGRFSISDPILTTHSALGIAEQTYQPTPVKAPLTLFNSNFPWGAQSDDKTLGWSGYSTGGIRIIEFDAARGTLILDKSPKAEAVGQCVRQLVDEQLSQRYD